MKSVSKISPQENIFANGKKVSSLRPTKIFSAAFTSALLFASSANFAYAGDDAVKPEASINASAASASTTTTSVAATQSAATADNRAPATTDTNNATGNKQLAAVGAAKPAADGTTVGAGSAADADAAVPKLLLKKGQPLVITSEQEDVQPTDDVELAKEQAVHFPDSAEASFVLAVALTRTSRVEEALSEVRRARKLAQAAGGPVYFDKMIKSYEDMLQDGEDPRVRYSLAWAYYMKAYLLAQDSRRALNNPALNKPTMNTPALNAAAATAIQAQIPPSSNTTAGGATTATTKATPTAAATTSTLASTTAPVATAQPALTAMPPGAADNSVPNTISAKAEKKKVDPLLAMTLLQGLNPEVAAKMAQSQTQPGKMPASQLPLIPTAIQKAAPSAVPQVHQYYAEALKNLDVVLAKKPDDVWALLYRWHLYAEDTGNLSEAMKHWKDAEHRFPSNPGVQLFLAEGYAKEGNLKEAIMHASKAVFLRGTGN